MAMIPMEHMGGGTLGTPEVIGTFTVNGTTYTRYRKVVNLGTITYNSGGQFSAAHNIASLDASKVLGLTVMISNTAGTTTFPVPYISPSGSVATWITATDVTLISAAQISAGNIAKATIEYYQ